MDTPVTIEVKLGWVIGWEAAWELKELLASTLMLVRGEQTVWNPDRPVVAQCLRPSPNNQLQ